MCRDEGRDMTTTELIELLKAYEYGGATGRSREVMFQAGNRIIGTDRVEFIGSGDGLLTELCLSLPGAERKTGRWIPMFDNTWQCSECERCEQFGENIESTSNFCPHCGASMRGNDDAD